MPIGILPTTSGKPLYLPIFWASKGSNRVIFNVGGNNYRIICTYRFKKMKAHLYVNWIGTHAEYDKLCNDGIQYTVADY